MNFLAAAATDTGLEKETNEDSFLVRILNGEKGKVAFAAMCDGMGGLAKGELASATMVKGFSDWMDNVFPHLYEVEFTLDDIQNELNSVVQYWNNRIVEYGSKNHSELGTTAAVIVLFDDEYLILNVGDSRVYEISDEINQLTVDQTLVQREVSRGVLTEEQARVDPRRSVLLQCIGASGGVQPVFSRGKTKSDAVYMLCSDGFRHEITSEEIWDGLHPSRMTSEQDMETCLRNLINMNMYRRETDNISAVTIRTY